jgi:hypothetical protein
MQTAQPRPGEENKHYCMARCGSADAHGLMLNTVRAHKEGHVVGYMVVTGPFCGASECVTVLERRANDAIKGKILEGEPHLRRGRPTSVCARCGKMLGVQGRLLLFRRMSTQSLERG